MPNWGQPSISGFSDGGLGGAWTRGMGGTFNPGSNQRLDSVTMYWSNGGASQNVRVGVYQGGALDNPSGASLVEDLGQLTITNTTGGWFTINSTTNPTLTNNQPTWIVARLVATSVNIWSSNSSAQAGDFQTARGRVQDSTTSSPGTALPSTLSGSTFANFWYPWYLTHTAIGPTITTQPTAVTRVLTNSRTATFTVAATGTGGLTYQWQLETGVGTGSYSNVADGSGITWSGGTSTTLTATLSAKTLSGRRVRCRVTDSNGTTDSNAVALTIFDGPQLTAFAPTNASGVSTATLTCDYVTGVGEAIEVRIPLADGDVAVTVTTT